MNALDKWTICLSHFVGSVGRDIGISPDPIDQRESTTMNVTPIRLLLLLSVAAAIPITPSLMPSTDATPPKVCVLAGAGTGCEVPRPGAHVLRPLEP
jgi:hypothetical protein